MDVVNMFLFGNTEMKDYLLEKWEYRKQDSAYKNFRDMLLPEQMTLFKEYEGLLTALYFDGCATMHAEDVKAFSAFIRNNQKDTER